MGGFLGIRFEVGGNITFSPCLKLVRIMLETSNLAQNYKHIRSFRKYTLTLLIVLMSTFFAENQRDFAKTAPLLKPLV